MPDRTRTERPSIVVSCTRVFVFALAAVLTLLSSPIRAVASDEPTSQTPPADEKPKRTVLALGQITDASGMGIRGVAVAARLASADGDSALLAAASTDAVGDFLLECDQPVSGEIAVTFTKPRFMDFVHRFQVRAAAPPPFIAEVLRGDVTVRGRVTDARNDDPVLRATVTVRAQQDEREGTTDSDGRFTIDGLSPGQGEISVEAKGFGREHRGIASLDEAGEIEIRVKPERVVHLKVANDDGKPISGAVVEVIDQQRDDLRGATSDGDGGAILGGIHFDARTLKARLSHPDHVSSEFFDRRVDLPPDASESHHEFIMDRAARITGRVLDAKSGSGIHGARVVAGDDDNDANPRDWTGVSGAFAVVGVRPGTTAVTVHRDEYAPELVVVEAKPGENAVVELKLLQGKPLAGHVRDSEGKPVPEATINAVRWRDRGTLGLRTVTDADGAFVLRNVPTDEFDVVVEAPGRPEVRETLNPKTATDLVITVPKSTNGAEKMSGPAVGDAAPSVTLITLDKKTLNPAEMKGKIVVLDFWATWCAPCIEEMTYLAEAKKKHAQRSDLVFIAISRDLEEDALRDYLRANPDKADWHHVFGDAGGVPTAAKAYGVTWIPRIFVISHEGKITSIHARRDEITRQIDAAIEAKGPAPAP